MNVWTKWVQMKPEKNLLKSNTSNTKINFHIIFGPCIQLVENIVNIHLHLLFASRNLLSNFSV